MSCNAVTLSKRARFVIELFTGKTKINGQSRPNDRWIFINPEESPNTKGQGAP